MAIDFPNTPTSGDSYTVGDKSWQWDGAKWIADGAFISPSILKVDQANSRVGIGTTTPTQTLDVNGIASASTFVVKSGTGTYAAGALGYTDSNWGLLYRPPQAGANAAHLFESFAGADLVAIKEDGKVGIGTTAPTGPLHIMAAGDGVDQLKISSTGGTTAEYGFLGASAAGDYMRYGYWTGAGFGSHFFEGKVGIGTTTPAYPLTVSDGSSAGMFQFDPAGLRIGSNHDGYEFNIVGGIPDGTSMGGQIRLGAASRGDSDLNVIQFLQNGAERLRIDNASGGGIACGLAGTRIDRGWSNYPSLTVLRDSSTGVSNVTYNEFRVHGAAGTWAGGSGADFSVNFRIDGSTYSSSDSRRKTNVENITGALASVNAIQGVSFNTLNSEGTEEVSTTMGGKRYGFIAQDLSVVAPNAVNHYEDEDTPNANGWCNAYSVDYGGMTPLLVEAIKELSARIEVLESV